MSTPNRSNRLAPALLLQICSLMGLATQLGCHPQKLERPEVSAPASQTLPAQDPSAILRQMEQVYRDADEYSDRGQVVLRYRERGDIHTDSAALAVSVRLPNEIRVDAYYSELVCDGKQLRARITDEKSNNIDGQILSRALDNELSLELVYQDATLREAMTSGMAGQPLQLNLLYADDPLKSVFAEDAKLKILETAEYEGAACYRVAASGAEGEFIFWIDGTTYMLRRLDYPAASLLPDLARSEMIQDLSLRVEFRDATFNPDFDNSSFSFAVPIDAKLVQAFVLPPPPLPTGLFGKQLADFACYRLDGSTISQKSLLGQTVVLLWYNDHPACRSTIAQLSEVYGSVAQDDSVAVFAVSAEPSSVSSNQLEANLAAWNVNVPVLRDLDACGRDVLGVPYTPTMLVLDKEGYLQIFEVGANSDLAQELPTILDRLRKGDDLAGEILADHDQQTAAYHETLRAAMADTGTPTPEPSPASNRPASDTPNDVTSGEADR